jgi:hypothetical protein
MSTSARYSNQSIPKYINGEPDLHKACKLKIGAAGVKYGYAPGFEITFVTNNHRGVVYEEPIEFRADVLLTKLDDDVMHPKRFYIQVDGECHRSGKVAIGQKSNDATRYRNYTVKQFCDEEGMIYYCFDWVNCEEDILKELTLDDIARLIGLIP